MGGCISLVHEQSESTTTAPSGHFTADVQRKSPLRTASPRTGTHTPSDRASRANSPERSLTKPKFVYNMYNRRFHNEESSIYLMPNDETEVNRLQDFHYMTKWVLEGNFHPPIGALLIGGMRVLDIGCGPATWILEMATDYPHSEFIGMDISPIFPTSVKPANAEFIEHNAVNGLPFPDNHFDFVYQRYLLGGYSMKDWKFVCNEIKRVTKPRGWVEFVEPDLTAYSSGPMFQEMMSFIVLAIKGKDMDGTLGKKIASFVSRCSDVPEPSLHSDFRSVPVNFGGQIGEMWANNIRSFTDALRPLLEANWGKMLDTDFHNRIEAILEECREYSSYTNFHYGYVQVIKS